MPNVNSMSMMRGRSSQHSGSRPVYVAKNVDQFSVPAPTIMPFVAPKTQIIDTSPVSDVLLSRKVNAAQNQQTATDIIKSSGELPPSAGGINYAYVVVGAGVLTLASFAIYKLAKGKRR